MKPSLTSTTVGLLALVSLSACAATVPAAKSTGTVAPSSSAAATTASTTPSSTASTPAPTTAASGAKTTVAQDTTTAAPAAKLFAEDFSAACRGIALPKAAAYGKAPGTHPALGQFGKGKDTQQAVLTESLTVAWNENSDALTAIELVGCAERTTETFVKDCNNYEFESKPDPDAIAKMYDATYKVSIREAKTGKEIGSGTIEAKQTDCPSFVLFEKGKTKNEYAWDEDAFEAILKDYVQI